MTRTRYFLPTAAFLIMILVSWSIPGASAVPLPGGTLDPLSIPKYVIPLVIPPVMNNNGAPDSYDIAVRQFRQQILPGGIWNTLNGRTDTFPPTTVWSYGTVNPAGVFNYPAFTIEATVNRPVKVKWMNQLVVDPVACAAAPGSSPACNYLSHTNPSRWYWPGFCYPGPSMSATRT